MKSLKTIFLLVLILLSVFDIQAQRAHAKARVKGAKAVTTNASNQTGQKIFRTMLPATAKVMFIDSVVVGKNDFLSSIPLGRDMGTLSSKLQGKKIFGQYENGFQDRRFFAKGDTLGSSLFSSNLLGDGWSTPLKMLSEDGVNFHSQNYPFLCSDGVTLFFSATGSESIGGRDIFMTVYDTDEGKWYKPQNYGLPFNSTANDYLLVVDDLDSLGWLVSDRYQPEDSVCIYTFVPTNPRQDFSNDDLEDSQIERYAKLMSIRDTWKFGRRHDAILRRNALVSSRAGGEKGEQIMFVVNDSRVITSLSDFKFDDSRKLYQQLQELQNLSNRTKKNLAAHRQNYREAKQVDKAKLTSEILEMEKQNEQQLHDIRWLEKQIRNQELKP